MSPKERDAVDKELARMAEDGIIEPSTSPWVSPAVLVEKKEGGGTRFCVDPGGGRSWRRRHSNG